MVIVACAPEPKRATRPPTSMAMSSAVSEGSAGRKDEPLPMRSADSMLMVTGPSTRTAAFFPGDSERSS
jgi:hypothetical protein